MGCHDEVAPQRVYRSYSFVPLDGGSILRLESVMSEVAIGGHLETLAVSRLDLDIENPRLPASFRRSAPSQLEIASYIDKHHDALRVARSIARHGYFVSEPLIAVADGERYTVVEGNRRLVALKGLCEDQIRDTLSAQTKGWETLERVPSDSEVPVVVVEERHEVEALLGFRHISGIEPWDPYAQARFVAELVQRNADFGEVARIVGRSESEVRSMYRDHDIVAQARSEFGIDTGRVEKAFGVLNAAMGIVKIREYIGAPAPRHVDAEYFPIPEEMQENLGRLIEYIYGDARGRGRVLSDSRQLRTLATILSEPTGSAERTLRRTRDLDAALAETVSHEDGARADLRKATQALVRASEKIRANGFDAGVLADQVEECRSALDAVTELVERS